MHVVRDDAVAVRIEPGDDGVVIGKGLGGKDSGSAPRRARRARASAGDRRRREAVEIVPAPSIDGDQDHDRDAAARLRGQAPAAGAKSRRRHASRAKASRSSAQDSTDQRTDAERSRNLDRLHVSQAGSVQFHATRSMIVGCLLRLPRPRRSFRRASRSIRDSRGICRPSFPTGRRGKHGFRELDEGIESFRRFEGTLARARIGCSRAARAGHARPARLQGLVLPRRSSTTRISATTRSTPGGSACSC